MKSRVLVTLPIRDADYAYLCSSLGNADTRLAEADGPSNADLRWADVVLGNLKPSSLLLDYPNIGWLHSPNVGLDAYRSVCEARPELVVSNSKGIVDHAVAEHAVALLLAMTRSLSVLIDAQRRHSWALIDDYSIHRTTVAGKSVHVLGYGSIARCLIGKLSGLGARVCVYRRRARGRDLKVERFLAYSQLELEVASADALMVLLPEAVETRGMVGEEVLAAMPPHAFLVNVGRGTTVDEEALVVELQRYGIRGAALDVFAHEPLPPESPLWDLPNVLISPHIAGRFDQEMRMQVEGFVSVWREREQSGEAH